MQTTAREDSVHASPRDAADVGNVAELEDDDAPATEIKGDDLYAEDDDLILDDDDDDSGVDEDLDDD